MAAVLQPAVVLVPAHPPVRSLSATFFAGRHWIAHGANTGAGAGVDVVDVVTAQRQHLVLDALRHEFDDDPRRWQTHDASDDEDGEYGMTKAACSTAWCEECGRLAVASGRRIFVFVPDANAPEVAVTWLPAVMVTATAQLSALSWVPGGAQSSGRRLVAAGRCIAVCSVPHAGRSGAAAPPSEEGGAEPGLHEASPPTLLSLHPVWSKPAGGAPISSCAATVDFFATAAQHDRIAYVWSAPADGSSGFLSQAIRHPRAVTALEWQPNRWCGAAARLLTLDAAGTARLWCQHGAPVASMLFGAGWSLPEQPHFFEACQLGDGRLHAVRWVGWGEGGGGEDEDEDEAALVVGVRGDASMAVWRASREHGCEPQLAAVGDAAGLCGGGSGSGGELFAFVERRRSHDALKVLLLSASEPCLWSGEWCLNGDGTSAPVQAALAPCVITAHASAPPALVSVPAATPAFGMVSLAGDGMCALAWGVDDGRAVSVPAVLRPPSGAGSFCAVAAASDKALLAVASTSGKLLLFACSSGRSPSWHRVAALDALDALRPWTPRALAVLPGPHPGPHPADASDRVTSRVLAVCPAGLHLQVWNVSYPTPGSTAPAASVGVEPFTYWCDEPIACLAAAVLPAWCWGATDMQSAACQPSLVCSVDECGQPTLWDFDAGSGACAIAPRLQTQARALAQPSSVATAAHLGRFLVAASGATAIGCEIHVWEGESDARGAALGTSGRLVLPDEKGDAGAVTDARPPSLLAWHAGGHRGLFPVLVVAWGNRLYGFVEQIDNVAPHGEAGRWTLLFAQTTLASPCTALCVHAGAIIAASAAGDLQLFDTVLSRDGRAASRQAHGISAFVESIRQPRPAFDPRSFESHVLLGQTETLLQALQHLSASLKGAGDSNDVLRQLLADVPLLLQPLQPAAPQRKDGSLLAVEAGAVASLLQRVHLPGMSDAQQAALLGLLDAASTVFCAADLDVAAQRFCLHATVSAREQHVRDEAAGVAAGAVSTPQLAATWAAPAPPAPCEAKGRWALTASDVAWAQASSHQGAIVQLCLPEQPTWSIVRGLGIALWLRDGDALAQLCRRIANVEYKSSGNDPARCALWHVALGQARVLGQLYSIAGERKVAELLVRDFSDARWQRAALKNAHALCSKHRYVLAAAFFILANKLAEAVSLCLKKMGDGQLACVVARLVGGVACDELRWVLGQTEGHRWLGAVSATLLGEPAACVLAALSKQECGDRGSDTEARTAKLFGLNVSQYDGIDRGVFAEGIAGDAAKHQGCVDALHREAAFHLGRDAMPLLALAELGRCRTAPHSWADRAFQQQQMHAAVAGREQQQQAQLVALLPFTLNA